VGIRPLSGVGASKGSPGPVRWIVAWVVGILAIVGLLAAYDDGTVNCVSSIYEEKDC
jgi:hypothetical protein